MRRSSGAVGIDQQHEVVEAGHRAGQVSSGPGPSGARSGRTGAASGLAGHGPAPGRRRAGAVAPGAMGQCGAAASSCSPPAVWSQTSGRGCGAAGPPPARRRRRRSSGGAAGAPATGGGPLGARRGDTRRRRRRPRRRGAATRRAGEGRQRAPVVPAGLERPRPLRLPRRPRAPRRPRRRAGSARRASSRPIPAPESAGGGCALRRDRRPAAALGVDVRQLVVDPVAGVARGHDALQPLGPPGALLRRTS